MAMFLRRARTEEERRPDVHRLLRKEASGISDVNHRRIQIVLGASAVLYSIWASNILARDLMTHKSKTEAIHEVLSAGYSSPVVQRHKYLIASETVLPYAMVLLAGIRRKVANRLAMELLVSPGVDMNALIEARRKRRAESKQKIRGFWKSRRLAD